MRALVQAPPDEDSWQAGFVHGDAAISFETTSATVLRHCVAYLHYPWRARLKDDDHWQVTSVLGPLDAREVTGGSSFESEYGDQARQFEDEATRVVVNDRTGSLIVINRAARTVHLMNSDERGLFIDTYKALRQIVTSSHERSGLIALHAAGVAIDGQGLIFLGSKAAGKTTSLVALSIVAGRRAAVLGNDRVYVSDGEPGAVFAWPTVVGIAYGTARATGLMDRLSEELHRHALGTAYLLLDHPILPESGLASAPGYSKSLTRPGEEEKIWLTPSELAIATGSQVGTSADLRTVILPEVSDRPPSVDLASRAELQAALEPNIHRTRPDHPDWMGLTSGQPSTEGSSFGLEATNVLRVNLGRSPLVGMRLALDAVGLA